MIAADVAIAAFHEAVGACDPGQRVAAAVAGLAGEIAAGHLRVGVAIGKAALAMARGAGPVARGLAVTVEGAPADADALPAGWDVMIAGHPVPDARSLAAAAAVRALVEDAADDEVVLALISGGASALVEEPRLPLAELTAITSALMAAGAPIDQLNTVRGALSALKAGQLVERSGAPAVTLVASDVIGDDLAVVGSGPTIGPWLERPGAPIDAGAAAEARRVAAIAILRSYGLAVPAVLATAVPSRLVARRDRALLVAPMRAFADAAARALVVRGIGSALDPVPFAGDVAAVADRLAASAGPRVLYGESTLRVPAVHGAGGRAQQLALELARRLRGTQVAALIAGTDGTDGPPPAGRPPPAGAYVDGATWDAIAAAGIDPAAALARCDAGTALHAVGALLVTGPTGVNHADVAILG